MQLLTILLQLYRWIQAYYMLISEWLTCICSKLLSYFLIYLYDIQHHIMFLLIFVALFQTNFKVNNLFSFHRNIILSWTVTIVSQSFCTDLSYRFHTNIYELLSWELYWHQEWTFIPKNKDYVVNNRKVTWHFAWQRDDFVYLTVPF